MSIFYTVEMFSTFKGFIVRQTKLGNIVSCSDMSIFSDFALENKILNNEITYGILRNINIETRRFALQFKDVVTKGKLKKISQTKFIIQKEQNNSKNKIICSRYKNFIIKEGSASYVIDPLPEHDFIFIEISPNTVLEMYNEPDQQKTIKYGDLN